MYCWNIIYLCVGIIGPNSKKSTIGICCCGCASVCCLCVILSSLFSYVAVIAATIIMLLLLQILPYILHAVGIAWAQPGVVRSNHIFEMNKNILSASVRYAQSAFMNDQS